MSPVRFSTWARLLSAAVLTAAWFGMSAVPAHADVTSASTTARAHDAARQHTAALNNLANGATASATGPSTRSGILNGFVYSTSPQSLAFGGRVNVGKTHVYVPYYGNVNTDPLHPNAQTFAGIGYGFRTWDVSVVNSGYNSAPVASAPGSDIPHPNQSLSFSIHF
jgi:hypothetical protein